MTDLNSAVFLGFPPVFPSLVREGHNSSNVLEDDIFLHDVINVDSPGVSPYKRARCPQSAGWLRGRCQHGNERWLHLSCKRRDCSVCGEIRRRRIAYRVEYGLQVLGAGAWIVVTWDYDVCKEEAVKTQNRLVKWIRKHLGIHVEYSAVWEEQKSGRLHLNLIVSPWRYINQRILSQKCVDFGAGRVVWVEKVQGGISAEVTKLQYKLGNYMAKFEQQVKTGRGINYSHGWPKLPENRLDRIGRIDWTWISPDYPEFTAIEQEIEVGVWQEIMPGEYSICGEPELCECFQYVPVGKTADSLGLVLPGWNPGCT